MRVFSRCIHPSLVDGFRSRTVTDALQLGACNPVQQRHADPLPLPLTIYLFSLFSKVKCNGCGGPRAMRLVPYEQGPHNPELYVNELGRRAALRVGKEPSQTSVV